MNLGKYQYAYDYMHSYFKRNQEEQSHTVRVLSYALQLLEAEKRADPEVVIVSALLHDIGRKEARASRQLKHSEVGAEKALQFLLEQGWDEARARHVADCIRTHSFKTAEEPATLEAKILFDADKLDLTGALGVVRSVVLGRQANEPVYTLGQDGMPAPGKKKDGASLLKEYRQKLRNMHKLLYTERGRKIAEKRRVFIEGFFDQMNKELFKNYHKGTRLLEKYCPPLPAAAAEETPAGGDGQ